MSDNPLNAYLEPGQLVTNPHAPEWGIGQIQSSIQGRITVNFEHRGKVVINGDTIALLPYFGD